MAGQDRKVRTDTRSVAAILRDLLSRNDQVANVRDMVPGEAPNLAGTERRLLVRAFDRTHFVITIRRVMDE